MKLVEDWKESYKWLSTNIAGIMVILNGLQATMPYLQELVSPSQMATFNALLGIAVIWGRLIQQGPR